MHSKASWSRIARFALEHGAATRDGGSAAHVPAAPVVDARPSSRKGLLLCVPESSARALVDAAYPSSAEQIPSPQP